MAKRKKLLVLGCSQREIEEITTTIPAGHFLIAIEPPLNIWEQLAQFRYICLGSKLNGSRLPFLKAAQRQLTFWADQGRQDKIRIFDFQPEVNFVPETDRLKVYPIKSAQALLDTLRAAPGP